MASHVRQSRAGYLKGDRVRLEVSCGCGTLNCQCQKLFWMRVVDFKRGQIGVMPEIHPDSLFRNWSGSPGKKSFKLYVKPDQLMRHPPCRPKNALVPGAVFCVYAARSVRRAAQAAGLESQPEQEPETPESLLGRSPAAAAGEAPARISRADPITEGFSADCKCWKCSFCDPAQHCCCGRLARCQAITCRARLR